MAHLLGAEEDADGVVVGSHEHALGDEPPGDGVLVAIEVDAEHLRDASALDFVGVEGGVGQRFEPSFLFVAEDERRHLACLLMHAPVGEVVAPGCWLGC